MLCNQTQLVLRRPPTAKKGRCWRRIKGKTAQGKEEEWKAMSQWRKKEKEGTGTESHWGPNNPTTECNAMQQPDADESAWEPFTTGLLPLHGWACVLMDLIHHKCWVWPFWESTARAWLAVGLKTYCICPAQLQLHALCSEWLPLRDPRYGQILAQGWQSRSSWSECTMLSSRASRAGWSGLLIDCAQEYLPLNTWKLPFLLMWQPL